MSGEDGACGEDGRGGHLGEAQLFTSNWFIIKDEAPLQSVAANKEIAFKKDTNKQNKVQISG